MYWIIKHFLNEAGQIVAYEVISGPFGTLNQADSDRNDQRQRDLHAKTNYGVWSMEAVTSLFGKKAKIGLHKKKGDEDESTKMDKGKQGKQ